MNWQSFLMGVLAGAGVVCVCLGAWWTWGRVVARKASE